MGLEAMIVFIDSDVPLAADPSVVNSYWQQLTKLPYDAVLKDLTPGVLASRSH